MALHESELSFLYIYCSGVSVHLCIMFQHSKTHVICNLQAMPLVHTPSIIHQHGTQCPTKETPTNTTLDNLQHSHPNLAAKRGRRANIRSSKHPAMPCRGLLCGPCFYISSPSTCHHTRGSCQHLHTFPRGFDNVISLHMIVSDVQVCLFGHWFAMSRSCGRPLVPVVDAALTKRESRCTYKVLLH